MAHHFKFHTAEDLEAECRRQGLPIRLDADLSVYNQPFTVGGFKVGNRWCVQPMEGCDGKLDGNPDELTFRRYRRFGAGGAKLIWGEAAAVVEAGRATPRQLWVAPHTLAGLAEMVRVCIPGGHVVVVDVFTSGPDQAEGASAPLPPPWHVTAPIANTKKPPLTTRSNFMVVSSSI